MPEDTSTFSECPFSTTGHKVAGRGSADGLVQAAKDVNLSVPLVVRLEGTNVEKGKAILWANMQEDWRKAEPAAVHKAFPVRKGVKWAATLWVHAAGFRITELYAGRQCASRS